MIHRKRISILLLLLTILTLSGASVVAAGGRPLSAALADSNEVPPSGTGASGVAYLTLNQGQEEICFDITATGLSGPVTGDHIHRAEAGIIGPVVVSFQGMLSGCVTADADIIKAIRQNPSGFYVNLHTALNPGGEIRGQLEK